MFTRQTVFVLGAGCSMPYDFPSGEELMHELVGKTLSKPTPDIFNHAGFKNEEVQQFGQDLDQSDPPSIDTFLRYRPKLLGIGKLAIAMQLAGLEVDAPLARLSRWGREYVPGRVPWYHYLWREMIAEKGHFGENQVSFVTFNYDRSLERYFFLRLRALHGYNNNEVLEELSRIRFVHIHGGLGDDKFIEYPYNKPKHSYDDLIQILQRLKIIHEDPAGNPNFTAAIELLQKAHCICFLGYGFHDLNNEGLQLVRIIEADPEERKYWFASRFQMTEVEFRRRTGKLYGRFLNRSTGKLKTEESDSALEVLRKLPIIE